MSSPSSVFELASAFAPTLHSFLVCRALFGVAMGGVWGVGAALALETLPAEGRGFFSGLLQEGYVCGKPATLPALLFAALLFSHLHGTWHLHQLAHPVHDWFPARAPRLPYLNYKVEESGPPGSRPGDQPGSLTQQARPSAPKRYWGALHRLHFPTFLFLVLLMTAFTSFSARHSRTYYPSFLGITDMRQSAAHRPNRRRRQHWRASPGRHLLRVALRKARPPPRTIVCAALLAVPNGSAVGLVARRPLPCSPSCVGGF